MAIKCLYLQIAKVDSGFKTEGVDYKQKMNNEWSG